MKSLKRWLALGCVAGAAWLQAANPLGFREYVQSFRLHFGSETEARQAEVTVRPLPRDYVMACSTRWDDTNLAHLRTNELMIRHGVPGTFFLGTVDGVLRNDKDYLKKLMSAGSSIGLHTVHHPQLPCLDAYAHFEEYMANRIDLETAGQVPVNSQALPFCAWNSECALVPASIGWAMRATGVISSPDVMYPQLGDRLGYPAKSFAMSNFFSPGDREPDVAKMRRWVDQKLKSVDKVAAQPSLTLGIHSWHTATGIKALDECFAMIAGRKDWWYCNHNEYGAYRYEALNATVKTDVQGQDVVVTVSRMEPFELGDNVPLWFGVKGTRPARVSGANALLHGNLVELQHDAAHALPTLYGRVKADGKADARLPFATLKLTRDGLKFKAELVNLDGAEALEKVAFTFRFPSVFAQETIREDVAKVAGGATHVAEVAQPSQREELYYRYGKPYFAVQVDFVRAGVRCRLYADLKEAKAQDLPKTVNDVVSFFTVPEQADYASLSQVGGSLEALTAIDGVSASGMGGAGVIYPYFRNWKLRGVVEKQPAVLVFELQTVDGAARDIEVVTSAGKGSELWLNGQQQKMGRSMKLSLKAGRNRVVLRNANTRAVTFFVNGEAKQTVEYLPLAAQ